MSSSGSDIGEEIRKLQLEEKQEQSRRSSLVDADNTKHVPTGRSRNTSISSYANSIVDVNSAARWGGYSPSAYVTSPKGSIRSGSWSHRSGVQRQPSVSKGSQSKGSLLGQFPEDSENADEAETATVHNEPQPPSAESSQPHTRNASQFSLEYDKIVQDIENELAAVPSQESAPAAGAYDRAAHGLIDPDDLPDRPATADTFQQAQTAFRDFDGVHYAPSSMMGLREISEGSEHSMLHSIQHAQQSGIPPPDDGMVYYPAPVPRMLNLPKRLSQLPSADVRMKRRTQVLENLSSEARNSALWLGGGDQPPNKRPGPRNSAHLDKLPPQLRASVYFDQPNVPHDVEIKGESAQATLDDILNASTTAPVSAFTDHPIAGPVGKAVYGKENKRKSTLEKRKSTTSLLDADKRKSSATLLDDEDKGEKKKEKRKSSLGFLLGRRSSTDEVSKQLKRNSSGDKINKLQKRNSQMSLGKTLEQNEADAAHKRQGSSSSHGSNINETTALRTESHDDVYNGLPVASRDGSEDEDDEGQLDDDEQFIGPPTTLLAELQMRKLQQRERNRTAATAFPNGMHSTLLQLDAVAEIEKRKRQAHRPNLAWEAPNQEEEDDEVPLGMLFPGRNGLVNQAGQIGTREDDWNRPLGLLEKKELEDSEPLSRRRNRLRGLPPNTPYTRDVSPGKRMTMHSTNSQEQGAPRLSVDLSPEPQQKQESDNEEEPLAARRERLRRKEALNSALGDMNSRPISGDFASEMMSQFGVLKDGEEKNGPKKDASPKTPGAVNEEEETLGQRRARLQAEAVARGSTTPSGLSPGNPLRPPLKASRSLADILSAHPAGHQADKISNDALLSSLPQGSLLHKNEQKTASRHANIREGNKRSTSHSLEKPLLDVPPPASDARTKSMVLDGASGGRGLLGKDYGTGLSAARRTSGQRQLDRRASMMTIGANTMGNNNMGMSMPNMNQSGFLAPQTGMMGMGMPMQQQPMMMGMGMPMQTPMMNMNMGMGMGYGMQPMMGQPYGMQPMMGQPYGMQPVNGMQMGMQTGMGMGVSNQMQLDSGMLDPGRRAAIDRWRQDVL
ncbi:hypothetical protein MPH_09569 [Macrophomina phaseolina MS6]|uniref:Uncharacterized protein n=1 Tax=Macrophomina phaseolina (strain MS6) TaxID=1126212 RepID=K2RKA5_MACPH|nr:hypothetical protein MPH_09569 [Macrophomina phaseolina MS6]